MTNWGVQNYGAYLSLDNDRPVFTDGIPVVVDVETDEQDNFVGLGLTQDGKTVYYYTRLELVSRFLASCKLIGHNLKGDAKWLVKWGVPIVADSLFADTILMSYCHNTTKESHGLKDLGKELGFEWPSYQELVGKGKSKQTLDKQPVELVANYCAMDVLVTYELYKHFKTKLDINAMRNYNQIELPLMRVLFEMELQGVTINVARLRELDQTFREQLDHLKASLCRISGREGLNPNSNKQIAEILTQYGLDLPKTPKGNFKVDKAVLEQYNDLDFVRTLLEYNKIEKLFSTFTQGMINRETLPKIYTTYNQISRNQAGVDRGISTGRLSSSDPNLQQIPTRTEEGKQIRELFVPREGFTLVDADYSQIEYRLLAHFTKEPVLLEAFRNGKDIHEETGKLLGVSRDIGKTLNFASIYGAQAAKIAKTAGVSEEHANKFIAEYWRKLPSVTAWITRVKYQARQQKGIFTMMKRWIPIPGIATNNKYERFHWERAAVNYTIQGSAAEIMKLALIELRKNGFLPILTVHDEFVFENDGLNEEEVSSHSSVIKHLMESVLTLDVPLVADVGVGSNWREAKND